MKQTTKLLMMGLLLLLSIGLQAKKVHTIGDSTMAPYDESATLTRGWGMYFGQFLTNGWTSVNYAKGGRDSRGGYNELWQNAKTNVEAGDYVLIQFAHNDEKIGGADREEVYNYYISKGMTAEAAALDTRGTTPSTTYKQWLTKIVNEVRAKGAIPVLVSAVCRCYFSNEKITRAGRHDLGDKFTILTEDGLKEGNKVPADDPLMDYPYHMKQLASELGVAFVDMTTATKELYESYGSVKCKATLFNEGDNTHYNTTGALLAARLCAQLMKEQGLLADNIVVPTDLSISPEEVDLGDGYKGQTATKELTLNGFGLEPAEGTIVLTATDGIALSKDKQTWSESVSVDYKNGTLVQNFYARIVLTATGRYNGTITATLNGKQVEVPVTINVIELGGGEPMSATWSLQQDDEATTQGEVATGNVVLSSLVKYGNISGKGIMACPGADAAAAKNGAWTAAEDDDPDRYIQLSIRCPEGKTLDIDHLQMKVGGHGGNGMRCHVYYSTDGFRTRTTIYAPSSMSSGVMNDVEATPVVSLEEGDELQLRLYPWYTSNATGKWICLSDVTVSGQWKNAGGISIEGKVVFKLDRGGVDQGDDALFSPEDMQAGFAAKKFTAGNALTLDGTVTYQGANNEKTVQTKIYNDTGASLAGAPTADNTLTLTLMPEDGFSFVPSKVSFEGARYGTDGGKLTVSMEAGQNTQELCSNADVNRSGKNLDIASFDYEVSSLVATADEPLRLNFSFLGLGKQKTMGLSNLVIEGQLVGSASTATKYVLTTIIEPAGAGTILRDPDLTSYKEGTEVTLTAKRNFGYKLIEWQSADGTSLGTQASLTLTMDAEKTVKAVFQPVPVYQVTTRTTNDAERTLGSVTLTPNDHNGQYEAGTEITAKAEESKILKFIQWTDQHENASATATRTLTVGSDMELVANYEVQDFIAVFDASANNYYAYPTTSGYPFPADITWDNERQAQAALVKVSDGSPCYTKDGGTPVVRNREGVVLAGINGLYQNGYRTTDVAFQYQFSTLGFTSASFEAMMAAKNMASKNWKAQYSLDGANYTDLDGYTWEMTANQAKPLSIALPQEAIGQPTVCIRITGVGDETLSSSYAFDQEFDGLPYTSHSESGVGNVYVLGAAEVAEDSDAPIVVGTLPAANASDVSATGRITISYNERIRPGESSLKATLTAANGTEVGIQPAWSSRSVSFDFVGLDYGTAYTLSLPSGYVEDRSGNKADALTLSFTTMNRQQPQSRLYDAVVDATGHTYLADDGTTIATYPTVQAAIDAAPTAQSKPWLIFIKNGRYNEHVDIPNTKPYLHFIGQERDKVIIADDKLCGGDNALHVSVGATVVVNANNTFFENLTLENSYGHERQAGPQALALNTQGDRIALNRVALLSYQDTWITTSNQKNRHYIKNSLIEGAVDFIYNGGDVYLDGDTLEINRPSGGYIVAPWHSEETRWGYVFQNNVIRPHRGVNVTDVWLGRPWHGTPKTVYINTKTYVNIPAKGWYNNMGGLPVLWADYGTVDANGNPLDLSQREDYYYYTDRETGEKHEAFGVKNFLTDEEAAQYTVKNVCAGTDGWQPELMCEACDAPLVTIESGRLKWSAVPYAICYVITKGGELVGFTTKTEWTAADASSDYKVQAVNEYGGLSNMSSNSEPTSMSHTPATTSSPVCIHQLDGKRIQALGRGVNIVCHEDGSVAKVIR